MEGPERQEGGILERAGNWKKWIRSPDQVCTFTQKAFFRS